MAPTFIDESGVFPDRNIDSRFHRLVEGFGLVREKLGEERYARLVDLAGHAKALFADDPADTNGKQMKDAHSCSRSRTCCATRDTVG